MILFVQESATVSRSATMLGDGGEHFRIILKAGLHMNRQACSDKAHARRKRHEIKGPNLGGMQEGDGIAEAHEGHHPVLNLRSPLGDEQIGQKSGAQVQGIDLSRQARKMYG